MKDNLEICKLEDGTEYKINDFIKVETREYHQLTRYLNREIKVEDIIKKFQNLENFERGLLGSYKDTSEEDIKLINEVNIFLDEFPYEAKDDCWTMEKGGYESDNHIVKEFTIKD